MILGVAATAVVCATLIALRVFPDWMPLPRDDGFQYLSMAQNALHGHIGYTSIVGFDEERSFGVVPAPAVTFPTGYPLVIAMVSLVGLPLETAALLVSALAALACLPILAWLVGRLGLSAPMRLAILGAFGINALVTKHGATAMSDSLFTLLVLAGAALLVGASLRAPEHRRSAWVGVGCAFGAAYFVRYAGLFLVFGVALLFVRHLLSRDRALIQGYALALVVGSATVAIGIARDLILVGNWLGGNQMAVPHEFLRVVLATAQALNGIFVYGPGPTSDTATSVARVLCLGLFYLGVLLLLAASVRRRSGRWLQVTRETSVVIDLALLSAVYGAGMFYAALTSPITYGVRMFLPVLPLLFVVIGFAIDRMFRVVRVPDALGWLSRVALVGSLVAYAFLNVSGPREPPVIDMPALAASLDAAGPSNESAREVIDRLAGQDGVILANEGHVVGYELQKRTVTLVSRDFSVVDWTEPNVRALVQQFRVSAVVITTGIRPGEPDDFSSPFVADLGSGRAPPWLRLVYRSPRILVYAPAVGA
jgi:hypothetical protein